MTALLPPITRDERARPHSRGETTCIRAWKRCAGRQVTRAHVRLGNNLALVAALASSLTRIEQTLAVALRARVSLEARLSDASVMPVRALSRDASWALIDLPVSGTTAAVEVDARAMALLLRRLCGSEPTPTSSVTPTRSEERALSWLWLESVASIADLPAWRAGFSPRVLAVHLDRGVALDQLDRSARHLAVDVRLRIDDQVVQLKVLVPGRAIEAALLRTQLPRRAASTPSQISTACVAGSVVAGRGMLSPQQLLRLKPGDTVTIAGLGWHSGRLVGSATLRTRCFEAHGALFPRGLELHTFTSAVHSPEAPLSDDVTHSLLPVEIEVELTRFTLPLAQLATLRPGAVLPLRQNDADPVTLRVGGRIIARAELVDIEGEVGARILQLVGPEEDR